MTPSSAKTPMEIAQKIRAFVRQLAPHVAQRETSLLLIEAAHELERLHGQGQAAEGARYRATLKFDNETRVVEGTFGEPLAADRLPEEPPVLKHIRSEPSSFSVTEEHLAAYADSLLHALKQAKKEAAINAENFHVTNQALVKYDEARIAAEAHAERLQGEVERLREDVVRLGAFRQCAKRYLWLREHHFECREHNEFGWSVRIDAEFQCDPPSISSVSDRGQLDAAIDERLHSQPASEPAIASRMRMAEKKQEGES